MNEEENKDIKELTAAVRELNSSMKKSMSTKKRIPQRIALGAAYGFGTLLALSIIAPLAVFLLGKIEWVPIVGNFAGEVVQELESN